MNSQIGMCRGQLAQLRACMIAIIGAFIVAPGFLYAQEVSEETLAPPAEETLAAPELINCGKIITSPGRYKLAAPCTNYSAGHAITIQASDVRLDLDGLTISGPLTNQCDRDGDGIIVVPESTDTNVRIRNVRIENGRVEGFVQGINLTRVDGSRLLDLKVTHNCNGIRLQLADRSRIHDNTVSKNLRVGVALSLANNNWIHHNTVNSNRGGLLLEAANYNVIGSNAILGSRNLGMLLTRTSSNDPSTSSNNNALLKNVVSNSKGKGIRILFGNMNIVADNIANNNGDEGFDILTSENLIQHNTANNNSTRGILANPGAIANIFQGNTAKGNHPDLEDDNPNCSNTWRKNIFGTAIEDNGPNKGCIR